jgi:dihydroflavonol-4-reductase
MRSDALCPGSVNWSSSSVAITGATGFLGGYLVDKLAARGARVIAVVRDPRKAQGLADRAEIRRADLAEPAALRAAFRGADAVISNAAVISFREPAKTYRTNVEGTRNVFEAIAAAGVRRAILISSAAVYRPSPRARDEHSPLRGADGRAPWNAYGSSKAEAERIAWELASRHGVALTTFRPNGISGARDPLLMGALARLGRLPLAPVPVFTQIGVVHAEDVAEAVALALEKPEVSSGRSYNLQGDSVSLWQIVRAYRDAGGAGPRWALPVPFPLLLRYVDQRARQELGWRPRGIAAVCADGAKSAP